MSNNWVPMLSSVFILVCMFILVRALEVCISVFMLISAAAPIRAPDVAMNYVTAATGACLAKPVICGQRGGGLDHVSLPRHPHLFFLPSLWLG